MNVLKSHRKDGMESKELAKLLRNKVPFHFTSSTLTGIKKNLISNGYIRTLAINSQSNLSLWTGKEFSFVSSQEDEMEHQSKKQLNLTLESDEQILQENNVLKSYLSKHGIDIEKVLSGNKSNKEKVLEIIAKNLTIRELGQMAKEQNVLEEFYLLKPEDFAEAYTSPINNGTKSQTKIHNGPTVEYYLRKLQRYRRKNNTRYNSWKIQEFIIRTLFANGGKLKSNDLSNKCHQQFSDLSPGFRRNAYQFLRKAGIIYLMDKHHTNVWGLVGF